MIGIGLVGIGKKKEQKPFSFGARHHRGRRACGRELHRESPAGPGAELTVGMHALCVEVPAGHAIGLGLDLFNVYYTPASTDPALRLGLSCDARSRLALPVVNSGDGAPQTHTLL